MKQLLITIAAVVLVGCGSKKSYEGKYFLEIRNDKLNVELKQNSLATLQEKKDALEGTWDIKGNLIIIKFDMGGDEIFFQFDKTSFKAVAFFKNGADATKEVIEENNGKDIILKKVGGLRQCKTCKKEVSVEAKSCPHCGQPDPAY